MMEVMEPGMTMMVIQINIINQRSRWTGNAKVKTRN